MRSVNKVIIIGNITRDPEVKKTMNGESLASFGLATNREWVTHSGDMQRSTEFHEIVAWGGLAEVTEKIIKRGMLVHVTGYLKTRSWDDAAGLKRFRTEIVADEIIVLEKRPRQEGYDDRAEQTTRDEMHTEVNASEGEEVILTD